MQLNHDDDAPVITTPRHTATSDTSNSNENLVGAITPSTVNGMTVTPQWSQLMPETTDVQEKKRIGTSSSSSGSSSSSSEEEEEEEVMTPWQSPNDLPERRVMVQRIITLTETKNALLSSTTTEQQQSTATLAKRIELSLYSHASSLDEYRNLSTLRRRLQSLVSLSYHEAAAARSLQMSPKRRFPSRNLDMTPDFAIKRRRLAEVSACPGFVKCSGRIFQKIGEDCVRNIFSFLEGKEVIANRAINHFASEFLPSCVLSLELHVLQLRKSMESEYFNLRKLTNLEKLVVFKQPSSNPISNSSSAIQQERAPLHAWGCAELDATQGNEGEEIVQQLAATLDAGAGRHLKHLQLVSVFSNTSQRNGLRALCDALSRGACPQLEDLLLGGNSIMDAGMADIARLLRSNAVPELARLDLRRNYVGEAGLRRLVLALSLGAAKKLQFLCMGGNILTDNCVTPLEGVLAGCACPQLRFLGLEDNFLSPEGVQTIIQAAVISGLAPKLHRVSCDGVASPVLL